MKEIRTALLGLLCITALVLASCAAMAEFREMAKDPDFKEGYTAGRDMAEKDRIVLDCAEHGLATRAVRNVRSYNATFEEQGKSEAYRAGFAHGYKEAYRENIESMCD